MPSKPLAHRIQVKEDKPAGERGTYLHAIEHGQPKARRAETLTSAGEARLRQREISEVVSFDKVEARFLVEKAHESRSRYVTNLPVHRPRVNSADQNVRDSRRIVGTPRAHHLRGPV
ncbi:MAG: hypothetical protein M3041_10370 [Acidobacteriota bacterium]|nr:hypothetical protein [Acidobacteriota bacterium]